MAINPKSGKFSPTDNTINGARQNCHYMHRPYNKALTYLEIKEVSFSKISAKNSYQEFFGQRLRMLVIIALYEAILDNIPVQGMHVHTAIIL